MRAHAKSMTTCMHHELGWPCAGALDRLEVVAEPAMGEKSVLSALRGALKAAQDTLEGSQVQRPQAACQSSCCAVLAMSFTGQDCVKRCCGGLEA